MSKEKYYPPPFCTKVGAPHTIWKEEDKQYFKKDFDELAGDADNETRIKIADSYKAICGTCFVDSLTPPEWKEKNEIYWENKKRLNEMIKKQRVRFFFRKIRRWFSLQIKRVFNQR